MTNAEIERATAVLRLLLTGREDDAVEKLRLLPSSLVDALRDVAALLENATSGVLMERPPGHPLHD